MVSPHRVTPNLCDDIHHALEVSYTSYGPVRDPSPNRMERYLYNYSLDPFGTLPEEVGSLLETYDGCVGDVMDVRCPSV